MRLDHEFTVPAPIDEVWKAVLDAERVAPCMPGATLTAVEGDTFKGTVKVKLGPVSLLYKGKGEFLEKNAEERKIVIKASGKDARGAGTAAATVTVTLTAEGGTTKGAVATDLNVTGKPAQFGRGMISEVGGKILDDFAGNLADMLGAAGGDEKTTDSTAAASASETATAGATTGTAAGSADSGSSTATAGATTGGPASGTESSQRPKLESVKPTASTPKEAEPIDLFDYAGASVAKRLAPVLAGLAALFAFLAVRRLLRRR
ncbi:SRPBCC family protein [Saccharomonospora sp. NB11]|uniref:SRPBCC family protein n=1 Tax=Saccharomonospora sp. NB11 TaxID=1642298 RepID=UPI0018D0818E|nr:SRPBCC family protein [Saccharomonospora sp. NB11]